MSKIIYTSWLKSDRSMLKLPERKAILRYAFKTGDMELGYAALTHNAYALTDLEKKELSDVLLASTSEIAQILAFRTIYNANDALAEKFAQEATITALLAVFKIKKNHSYSVKFLKACWARKDDDLRFQVLQKIHWANHNKLPSKTWSIWFVKNYGSKSEKGFNSKKWDVLLSMDRDWEDRLCTASTTAKDMVGLSYTYLHSHSKNAHAYDAESKATSYQNTMATCLPDLDFNTLSKSERTLILEAYVSSVDSLPYSENMPGKASFSTTVTLIAKMRESQKLHHDTEIDSMLDDLEYQLRINKETSGDTSGLTEEELLTKLQEGSFPEVLKGVVGGKPNPTNKLYISAIESSKLPLDYLPSLMEWVENIPLDALIKNKSNAWLLKFAIKHWAKKASVLYLVNFFKEAPESVQYKFVDKLLKEQPHSLHSLQNMDLITGYTLEQMQVADLLAYGNSRTWELLRGSTAYKLGDDSDNWNIFESFVEGFKGTYRELLEAVTLCKKS